MSNLVIRSVDDLNNVLSQFDSSAYNLVLPTQDVQFVAPDHEIVVSTATLSVEARAGDVYPLQSRRVQRGGEWVDDVQLYALARDGLTTLVSLSGGAFRTDVPLPVRDSEGRVTAKSILEITGVDGRTRRWPAVYTFDTVDRVEEEQRRFNQSVEDGPANWFRRNSNEGEEDYNRRWYVYCRKKFEDARGRLIRFATSRADTGAMTRAARMGLKIKQGYTPEEITRPFVVIHVLPPRVPDFDFSHPFAQQLMSMAMLNGSPLVFPQMPASPVSFVDPGSDAGLDMLVDESAEVDFVEEPAVIEEMEVLGVKTDTEPSGEPRNGGVDTAGKADKGNDKGEVRKTPEMAGISDLRSAVQSALPKASEEDRKRIVENYLQKSDGDIVQALRAFGNAMKRK